MTGESQKKIKVEGIDYLLFSVSCALIATLSLPLFQALVHATVNIFAGGRSVSKTLLFLVYLLLLGLIAKFFKNKEAREYFWYKFIFLGGLAVCFGINLASFFYFIKQNGLQVNDWIIAFSGREISSTSLIHNHVSKGAVGFLLNLLGFNSVENLDAGFVFSSSLPKIIFIATIGIVFFLVIWSLVLFSKRASGEKGRLSLVTIGYSIASFSLIKNIVDGGLLNYETIVSLAFIILFIFPEKRWAKYSAVIILILQIIGTIGLYFGGLFEHSGNPAHGLISNLVSSVSYTALLFALYYFQKNEINRQGILLAVLLFFTVNFSILGDFGIIEYRLKPIDQNNPAILAAYGKIREAGYEEMGSIGDLNFYQVAPDKKTTVGNIINKRNLLDNFYPLTFPYRNCFPRGRPKVYKYELAVRQELSFEKFKNTFATLAVKKINEKSGNFFYEVSMEIQPCLPRQMNIIQETWREAGINNFLIMNILEADYGNT